MKDSILSYISKKINKLFPGAVVDGRLVDWDVIWGSSCFDLYILLQKCVARHAESSGLIFSALFETEEGEDCSLSQSMPVAPHEVNFNDVGSTDTVYGMYCHIINNDVVDLCGYIDELSKVTGEICVSEIDDSQHAIRNSVVGVIFSGKPVRTFSFDCWSIIGPDGKRYATAETGNNNRNESWLVPVNSTIEAIICNSNGRKFVESFNLNIPIWDIL